MLQMCQKAWPEKIGELVASNRPLTSTVQARRPLIYTGQTPSTLDNFWRGLQQGKPCKKIDPCDLWLIHGIVPYVTERTRLDCNWQ